jgi:hypothetical protein
MASSLLNRAPSDAAFSEFSAQLQRKSGVKSVRTGSFLKRGVSTVLLNKDSLLRSGSSVGAEDDREVGPSDFSSMFGPGGCVAQPQQHLNKRTPSFVAASSVSSSMGGMTAAKQAASHIHNSKAFVFRRHAEQQSRDAAERDERSVPGPGVLARSGTSGSDLAGNAAGQSGGLSAFLALSGRNNSSVLPPPQPTSLKRLHSSFASAIPLHSRTEASARGEQATCSFTHDSTLLTRLNKRAKV